MESQLGVRLFDRSSGKADPTRYAELLMTRGRGLVQGAANLGRELRQLAEGTGARLRIAAGPATRLKPLPQVMMGMLGRFPGLQLEATHEHGLDMMRGLSEGRHDVVFGYYENAAPYGHLIRVKLFQDNYMCLAKPGHPALAIPYPLTPRDLLEFPIASVGLTREFERWAGELSPEEERRALAFVSDDFQLIRQAAATCGLVARGPRFAFSDMLASGDLVEVPTTWSAIYECWMLTTETNWQSPIVRAVAEFAKAASEAG